MAVKFVQEIDVDGNVTSDGFVKNGGTSAGFLKADGSVDTSSYTTSAGTVGGNGAVYRIPVFSAGGNDVENSTISDNGTTVTMGEGALTLNDSSFNIIKASADLQIVGSSDTVHNMELGSSSVDFNTITLRASNKISYKADNIEKTTIDGNGHIVTVGDVEGTKIVKTGGTSGQFLKADGSVDSNTYATGTIPTATSDLTNDSSFITAGDIPSIPTNNNQLTNGENYITSADIPSIPTNNNQLTNGKGYIDSTSLPTATSDLTNDSGFLTSTSGLVLDTGTQTIAGNKTFSNTVKFSGTFGNLDTTNDKGMQFELGTSAQNTLRTDADAFRIYFGGTSGIGQAYNISQTGQHDWDGASGGNKMRLTTGGDLHVDGDVIAYSTTVSDVSMKENIKTIENATETVKELRGVSYDWKKGSRKGKSEIGLIAQEVEQVLPDLVHEKEMISGDTIKTVDYQKIIGLLIESNKELSARLEKLECGCSSCDCK